MTASLCTNDDDAGRFVTTDADIDDNIKRKRFRLKIAVAAYNILRQLGPCVGDLHTPSVVRRHEGSTHEKPWRELEGFFLGRRERGRPSRTWDRPSQASKSRDMSPDLCAI